MIEKKSAGKREKKRYVMILDFHRGIYFGKLVATRNNERTVDVEEGRHCFRYGVAEAGHRGVYGLAIVGPAAGAKIGPAVKMTIHDVAKIVECTPEAVERWKKIIW